VDCLVAFARLTERTNTRDACREIYPAGMIPATMGAVSRWAGDLKQAEARYRQAIQAAILGGNSGR